MARVFGEIPRVPPGRKFSDRRALAAANVHRPIEAGISGAQKEGADSIVVSGGYEDDEDFGHMVIYTGQGGNEGKRQVADQTLTRGNLALAVSCDHGLPVRVIRGPRGDPAYSPSSGFRYDGLFYVESYWQATGKSGFKIWRYRLVQEPPLGSSAETPAPPPGRRQRVYTSVQRIVRNTAITEWVKRQYDYTCQICRLRLLTAATPYAEGAHLRPLGEPHNGPDDAENILCLCPNHHVLLDRGAIGLQPSADGPKRSWQVIDLLTGGVLGPLTIRPGHKLSAAHAAYHRRLFR